MPEMKITLDGINGRLTITEEKISELEDILIWIIQNETKIIFKMNSTSLNFRITSSGLLYMTLESLEENRKKAWWEKI